MKRDVITGCVVNLFDHNDLRHPYFFLYSNSYFFVSIFNKFLVLTLHRWNFGILITVIFVGNILLQLNAIIQVERQLYLAEEILVYENSNFSAIVKCCVRFRKLQLLQKAKWQCGNSFFLLMIISLIVIIIFIYTARRRHSVHMFDVSIQCIGDVAIGFA